MKIRNLLFSIFTCVFLSACVYLPKPVESEYAECKLATKKYVLEQDPVFTNNLQDLAGNFMDNCVPGMCGAPLVVGLGYLTIPSTSYVVSGSVVLLGNTLHWLEAMGKCDDQYLESQSGLFLEQFDHDELDYGM